MAASLPSHSLIGEAPDSRRDLYAPESVPSFDNADTIVMRRSSVVPVSSARPRPAPVWSAPESNVSLAPVSARGEAPVSGPASASGERLIASVQPAAPEATPPRGGRLRGATRVVAGVAIALVVAGLAAYAGTYLFFLFNRSWVAPTILTPGDARVIGFASRYVEASARREALLLQRADVEMRIHEAERRLQVEQAFQAASLAAKDWMAPEAEPPAAHADEPGAAIAEDVPSPSTYDAVKLAADHDRSVVAAQKASDEIAMATGTLAALDRTVQEQERILQAMRRSPYYGITADRAFFAFVPYDNAPGATEGAAVYACRLGVAACRRVGRLARAAEGEVVQKHPWLQKDVRGTLVRVELDDEAAAENVILYVGRPPSPL